MSYSLNLAKAKELGLTPLIRKVKDRIVMTSNKDGEETETHTLEVELYDAQAALALLGKYHGLFIDTTKHEGEVILNVIYDRKKPSPEDEP